VKKLISTFIMTLILLSMLTFAFNIQPVKASGTIYIRADGSIDPLTANITTVDNVTYTFTDNNHGELVVERDNIVINGAGYTLQGTEGEGITLHTVSNVTVKNMIVNGFTYGVILNESLYSVISESLIKENDWSGIWIIGGGNNSILNNTIETNVVGIGMRYSWNNTMCRNNIQDNTNFGIHLVSSNMNIIFRNNITYNANGIGVYDSSWNTINENVVGGNDYHGVSFANYTAIYNTVVANTITNNGIGLFLGSQNNTVYHNNFANNSKQCECWGPNVFDDGYPSGGNYWSDYNGTDLYGGPYQNVTGSDGIGDTPYTVSYGVQDNFPLMNPFGEQTLPSLPVASFTWAPSTPNVNEFVTFDASASIPRGGIIMKYEWCFGDGGNTTGKRVTHKFMTEGEFLVTLNVTDSEGLWDIEQKQIAINVSLPPDLKIVSPDISFSDFNPSEGEVITISATIHNVGDGNADGLYVRFFDSATLIGEDYISSIPYNSHEVASIEWQANGERFHLVKVVVDPDNKVSETDEENNEATRSVLVGRLVGYGGIELTRHLTQSETYPGSRLRVYGYAIYNTTYGDNAPVAGADITVSITGKRDQWKSHTTSNGYYNAEIVAPYTPDNYTIVITVTDFTFFKSTVVGLTVLEWQEGTGGGEGIEGVDLTLSSSSISFSQAKPVENDNITITTNIYNVGNLDATNVLVRFYDNNNPIGEKVISSISANGRKTTFIFWKVSTAGTHYIKVQVDPENTIIELNENNNIATKSIYVYPAWPDITPLAPIFSDSTPAADQLITINATIRNIGGLDATNILIRFYDNDTLIDEQTILSVPGKGSKTTSITHSFSTAGWHNVTIKVDPEKTILEANEDNNEAIKEIYVHPRAPDLTLFSSDITFSNSTPMNGDLITIYAKIRNVGELNADNVSVKFLDHSATISLVNVSLIPASSYTTVDTSWNATPNGWHCIKVIIDHYNTINETNENNNIATQWINVHAFEDPTSDLYIYAEDIVFSNMHPNPGETVTIYATIHNNGFADAHNISVVFSIDNELTLSNQMISLLQVGESKTLLTCWLASQNGSHVVKVEIDPDYIINDPDINNNAATKAILVGDPPPTPPIASFTYVPYLPIVGETITFDASASYDPDGEIVSWQWAFGDGNTTEGEITTYSYSSEGNYMVTLTITDNEGELSILDRTIEIVIKKPVVILVHGFHADDYNPNNIWYNMKNDLNDSYTVYVSHYAYDTVTALSIQEYAGNLQNEINQIMNDEGVTKVDIVAHSMGGLIARYYIEMMNGYKNVRKLVMLETPNQGANKYLLPLILSQVNPQIAELSTAIKDALAPVPLSSEVKAKIYLVNLSVKLASIFGTALGMMKYWDSVKEMSSNHQFLKILNDNYALNFKNKVNYSILGGWLFEFSFLKTFDLDGVDKEMVSDISDPIAGFHSNLPHNPKIIQRVKEILYEGSHNFPATLAIEDNATTQLTPSIEGKIGQGESKLHKISVGSASLVNFVLAWQEGSLNLTLKMPNGTLITPSIAENNSKITYYDCENLTIKGYVIENPGIGVWTANVTAFSIAGEQNYTITTMLDTNITLTLPLPRYRYDSAEPIEIVAVIGHGVDPIPNASVTAKIQGPGGAFETIMLFDDGLHNDNLTNDGIYANIYTNSNLWGTYDIIVTVNGTVNNIQYARESLTMVWVEQYPDLTLNETDIKVSEEFPLENQIITIYATISNVGHADATNATILFYDNLPEKGILIGECLISINASMYKTASVQWNATCGNHEIYVLISLCNPFLEENYTNNMAHKPIYIYKHDIAIQVVSPSKSVVGTGFSFSINVTVENQGDFNETFSIIAYANTTIIGIQNVTLANGNSTTITIIWNTMNTSYGNYTISAYITPLVGEIDVSDNNFIDGWVFVTIPGDVDGDRDVDIFDIVSMAGVYGEVFPPVWPIPPPDIDGDGDVDIYDIVIAAGNYGKSW